MSGLLDVFNRCKDDLASMSEFERHYIHREPPLTDNVRPSEPMRALPADWHEQMMRMALTTLALGIACQIDAAYNESPDCVPKEKR